MYLTGIGGGPEATVVVVGTVVVEVVPSVVVVVVDVVVVTVDVVVESIAASGDEHDATTRRVVSNTTPAAGFVTSRRTACPSFATAPDRCSGSMPHRCCYRPSYRSGGRI